MRVRRKRGSPEGPAGEKQPFGGFLRQSLKRGWAEPTVLPQAGKRKVFCAEGEADYGICVFSGRI